MIYIKRHRQSAWERRDFFTSNAYLRHSPLNLSPDCLAFSLRCNLAAKTLVTPTKCYLYLMSGNATCMDCARLFRKARLALNPVRHFLTYKELPILKVYASNFMASLKNKLKSPDTSFTFEYDQLYENKKTKYARHSIKLAMPRYEQKEEVPDPPKDQKFLYVGTCIDCGDEKVRIVTLDLCWRCYWIFKKELGFDVK